MCGAHSQTRIVWQWPHGRTIESGWHKRHTRRTIYNVHNVCVCVSWRYVAAGSSTIYSRMVSCVRMKTGIWVGEKRYYHSTEWVCYRWRKYIAIHLPSEQVNFRRTNTAQGCDQLWACWFYFYEIRNMLHNGKLFATETQSGIWVFSIHIFPPTLSSFIVIFSSIE